MAVSNLEDLYLDELKDLYNAENQLVKALPKMAKAAGSDELRQAFEHHLEQTKNQVTRLEKVFQTRGMKPKGKKCMGMEGIIEEGKEMMQGEMESSALDAALIAAAQKAEHYEIASYGTVRTWARELGDFESADLLQQTLDEEGEANKLLTRLAEAGINVKAEEGDGHMGHEHTHESRTA